MHNFTVVEMQNTGWVGWEMHYYISLQSYHIINISFRALRALIKSQIIFLRLP